jgi:hypothetical protein
MTAPPNEYHILAGILGNSRLRDLEPKIDEALASQIEIELGLIRRAGKKGADVQDAKNLSISVAYRTQLDSAFPYLTATRHILEYTARFQPDEQLVAVHPQQIFPFLVITRDADIQGTFACAHAQIDAIRRSLEQCYDKLDGIQTESDNLSVRSLRDYLSTAVSEIISTPGTLNFIQKYKTTNFISQSNPALNLDDEMQIRENSRNLSSIFSFIARYRFRTGASGSLRFNVKSREEASTALPSKIWEVIIAREDSEIGRVELLRQTGVSAGESYFDWPAIYDITELFNQLNIFASEKTEVYLTSPSGTKTTIRFSEKTLSKGPRRIREMLHKYIKDGKAVPWIQIRTEAYEVDLPLLNVGADWVPRVVFRRKSEAASEFLATIFKATSLYYAGSKIADLMAPNFFFKK